MDPPTVKITCPSANSSVTFQAEQTLAPSLCTHGSQAVLVSHHPLKVSRSPGTSVYTKSQPQSHPISPLTALRAPSCNLRSPACA